jgi:integrase
MPLTELQIKGEKPAEKSKRLSDAHGLYLLLNPDGSRWWRMDYRFAGKRKTLSLGTYPDVSLKDARAKLEDARGDIRRGVDPSEKRRATKTSGKGANSFETIAREWFTKFKSSWVDAHSDRILRRLERDVFPWIGEQDIATIKVQVLLTVLRRIENRGAVETAHRALQNCSQIFRYAVATGRAERDITADLRGAIPPSKAKNHAAITEPELIGALLRVMDGYEGGLITRAALRLAPLVFVRPGELRHAKWADIDLKAAEWRFVSSKTKQPHLVPLSSQAVTILKDLQPLTAESEYVFPSARSFRRAMSANAVLAALRRMGYGNEDMTGHGFRAMARTVLDEVLGQRVDWIEHQLAHAVKDANGRAYNRTAHLPQRREMMQVWADYLDGLRESATQKISAKTG